MRRERERGAEREGGERGGGEREKQHNIDRIVQKLPLT